MKVSNVIKLSLILSLSVATSNVAIAETDNDSDVNVYVIGSFNNWQVPTSENLNGAIQLVKNVSKENDSQSYNNYSASCELPVGDTKFILYVEKVDDAEPFYIARTQKDATYQTLYAIDTDKDAVALFLGDRLVNELNDRTALPFELKDWNGEQLSIELITGKDFSSYWRNYHIYVSSDKASTVSEPDALYTIITAADGTAEVYDNSSVSDIEINAEANGGEFYVLYSTENSTTPDQDNCYGFDEGVTDISIFRNYDMSAYWYDYSNSNYIKGSLTPLHVIYEEGFDRITISTTPNWDNGFIYTFVKCSYISGIEDVESEGESSYNESAPLYDLMGRRITSPAKGQIYIQNGKKFIGQSAMRN
jgi:hypothetical protein